MYTYSPLGRLLTHYFERVLPPVEFGRLWFYLSFETSPLINSVVTTISEKYGLAYNTIEFRRKHTTELPAHSSRLSRYSEFINRMESVLASGTTCDSIKTAYSDTHDIYIRTVRAFYNLKRFAHIWRIRKNKYTRYEVDTDLMMNPLDELRPAHRISLLENNTFYEFKIHDLLNIMKTSLYHCSYGFPGPNKIKNPYTNMQFSQANLFNIYFKTRFDTILVIHPIIQRFFESEMNLSWFRLHNEDKLVYNARTLMADSMTSQAKYNLLRDVFLKYPRVVKGRWLPENISNIEREWVVSKAGHIIKLYMLMNCVQLDDLYAHYSTILQKYLRVFMEKYPLLNNLNLRQRSTKKQRDSLFLLMGTI